MLRSRGSQAAQLLSALCTRPIWRIRVLRWGHHMPAIQRWIRWALLLSMMLLMMLLLPVGRGRRVVLRRGRDLLVLMLGARGGAQSNLGRGCLLLMMLMLSRGRDGQWGRGCSVGRLWRAWATAASGAGPTTPSLLAGTGSVGSFIFTVVLVLFGRRGSAADGQPTWDIVGTRSGHAHWPRRAANGCADRHR
jgi:hypothetical protein